MQAAVALQPLNLIEHMEKVVWGSAEICIATCGIVRRSPYWTVNDVATNWECYHGGIEDVSQERNAKPKRPLSSGRIE